jgi:hypothetical protein
MIRQTLRRIVPRRAYMTFRAVRATLRDYRILSKYYGHYKTAQRWECVDKDNNAIPWYSYPAIEYLRQLDVSDKSVFEYGSGNSSIFWAQRCKRLVCAEDDREWYDKIKSKLPRNVEYLLVQEKDDYVKAIHRDPGQFDVIIIDGNHRYECAAEAVKKLKSDGFIILDNAEWEGQTSGFLRDADLIEVDMSGFGPINGYTTTTSFYFSRNVTLKPAHSRQPMPSVGNSRYFWRSEQHP